MKLYDSNEESLLKIKIKPIEKIKINKFIVVA